MKNKFLNILVLISFIIITLFTLTGCDAFPEENKGNRINEKSVAELEYVEDSVFNITNKYAKGEYLKDDILNWDDILKDEKRINEVLETIILDLSEVNIKKEDVVKISSELNNLLTITIEENEPELLFKLHSLYSLVPSFLEQFSDNKIEIENKKLKAMALLSYAYANNEAWEEAKKSIDDTINKYNELINDTEYLKEEDYKTNRIYILLGEIKSAIDLENLELTKLKFVNFIEKM